MTRACIWLCPQSSKHDKIRYTMQTFAREPTKSFAFRTGEVMSLGLPQETLQ